MKVKMISVLMWLKVEKAANTQASGRVSVYPSGIYTGLIRNQLSWQPPVLLPYLYLHVACFLIPKSKSYLDPSPGEKFSPDTMGWPSTIAHSWFIISGQISTLESKHIMFNEPKILHHRKWPNSGRLCLSCAFTWWFIFLRLQSILFDIWN